MSTLAANVLTLADFAKRLDPSGKTSTIVELLSQNNGMLRDMLWMEGNLPTGHRTTVRTGLPNIYWRLLNQGVQPSKSTTAQVDEACGMLEAWSEVDCKLANLAGDVNQFRLSESVAFVEAMTQEFIQTFFYGNSSTAPEEFMGLSPRYSTISGATNAKNIIDGGGTQSDNSSIWLCAWGANSITGIFPKGSMAGLQHKDLGEVTVETTAGIAGSRMRAYQDQFQWDCGIALKDWRFVVRIPNIDISNLIAKSSAADLFDLMIKATHRLPSLTAGKPVFYMNRTVFQMLDIQRRDDVISGGQLTYSESDGLLIPRFRGIPIVVTDQLLETEARVV